MQPHSGTGDEPEVTKVTGEIRELPEPELPQMSPEEMMKMVHRLNGIANHMSAREKRQAKARSRAKMARKNRKKNRKK